MKTAILLSQLLLIPASYLQADERTSELPIPSLLAPDDDLKRDVSGSSCGALQFLTPYGLERV